METSFNTNNNLFYLGKKIDVVDEAWDAFLDYIGEKKLQTPLTHEKFEEVLKIVDKKNEFVNHKSKILHSFQNDSYAWPLVEK